MELANQGWTDEARAASLAVRRAKAAARREKEAAERGTETKTTSRTKKPTSDEAEAYYDSLHDQAEWDDMGRRYEEMLAEDAEYEERQRQRRQSLFDWQDREVDPALGPYHERHWYPRGMDGLNKDPKIGKRSAEAPYGYRTHDGVARTEPLYDEMGYPIIPTNWMELNKVEWYDSAKAKYDAEKKAALEKWGRFGSRAEFFRQHPTATEDDWKDTDWNRGRIRDLLKDVADARAEFKQKNPSASPGEWEKQRLKMVRSRIDKILLDLKRRREKRGAGG